MAGVKALYCRLFGHRRGKVVEDCREGQPAGGHPYTCQKWQSCSRCGLLLSWDVLHQYFVFPYRGVDRV